MQAKQLLLLFTAVWGSAQATELTILKPLNAGNVDSYFPLESAFDGQTQWDSQTAAPLATGSGADAPAYGDRLGYIDLGPNYGQWRITQSWTEYRPWSGGDHTGFVEMWWDNDKDNFNDGIAEQQIQFNGAQALPHQGTALWHAGMQLPTEQAITPAARYLMIRSSTSITNRAKEYAFVGWLDESAPPPPDISVKTPLLTLPVPQSFDYQQLTLVDEITFSATAAEGHSFTESAPGVSKIETLLGQSCRTMSNTDDNGKYFAYRLAANNQLKAGKGYVLVVDYPDDQARTMVISNHGAEINRGFHTGNTVGDALYAPYEKPTAESVHYGMSQQIRSFEQLFHLHDRFPELGAKPKASGERSNTPKDGFWLAISQFGHKDGPLSNGAAVCRIALYEAPTLAQYTQPLATLPNNLPQRQLFYREEMADGVVSDNDPAKRGLDDPINWFENRAKLMKFLGMNTYTQDLLEFGHNQGWDSGPFVTKNESWYVISQYPHRWEQILNRLMQGNYGFNLLPYYEYAGADDKGGLGSQKQAAPLYRTDGKYTAAGWAENQNIDVSDPRAVTDALKLLDASLVSQFKGQRPVPKTVGESKGLGGTWREGWGYLDLGENWADVRITQGWTRSRQWNGGPATPYQKVAWYNGSLTAFDAATLTAENTEATINFISQNQSQTSFAWTKDFSVSTEQAIVPKGRYLAFETQPGFTDVYEILLMGYNVNGPAVEQPLNLSGGALNSSHDMALLLDNQPAFNAAPAMSVSGIWLRPRVSAIPYGFGVQTLARFAATLPNMPQVSKLDLQQNAALLAQYYDWWGLQRKQFLNQIRDHVKQQLNPNAVVIFTADTSECGPSYPYANFRVISDEISDWNNTSVPVMPFSQAIDQQLHFSAQTLPSSTWGGWEYQHAIARPDVANYQANDGVMMSYSFNDLYTVTNAQSLNAFATESGTAAIRHYCLNEDAMVTTDKVNLLGYFVSDIELAGPYITLPEARALANGDPYYFGYLSSNSFNRSFPGYVRDFNANYLALPALSSELRNDLTTKQGIVVRTITTANDGVWMAIINTGLEEALGTELSLPVNGVVTNAVTGAEMTLNEGKLLLDLRPGQLVSVRIITAGI